MSSFFELLIRQIILAGFLILKHLQILGVNLTRSWCMRHYISKFYLGFLPVFINEFGMNLFIFLCLSCSVWFQCDIN